MIAIGIGNYIGHSSSRNWTQRSWDGGTTPVINWGTRKVISVIGDSITRGAISGATDLDWLTNGYVGQLRTLFQTKYGNGGIGWVEMIDSRWTPSAPWSDWTVFSPFGHSKYKTGDTFIYTLDIASGDNVDLFYYENGGTGDWTYKVDGGSPVTVTATNDSVTKKLNISLGSVGTHSLEIKAGNGGNCILLGAAIYIGNSGFVINNISLSGQKISDMIFGLPGNWIPILTFLESQLILSCAVVNDYDGQTSLASYEADCVTAFAAYKSICPYMTILAPKVNSSKTIPQIDYENKVKTLTEADNYAWIDIDKAWGNIFVNAKMADIIHPNLAGHTDMAAIIRQSLKRVGL